MLLSLFRAPCLRGQLVFRSEIAQVGGRNLSKAYLRFLGMKAVSCDGTGLWWNLSWYLTLIFFSASDPYSLSEKLALPLSEPAVSVLVHPEQYLLKAVSFSPKDFLPDEIHLLPNNCIAKSCNWKACFCKQSDFSLEFWRCGSVCHSVSSLGPPDTTQFPWVWRVWTK